MLTAQDSSYISCEFNYNICSIQKIVTTLTQKCIFQSELVIEQHFWLKISCPDNYVSQTSFLTYYDVIFDVIDSCCDTIKIRNYFAVAGWCFHDGPW